MSWRLLETDYISMSLGHELVAVHGMRDISLGQINTFTFCIKKNRMLWRLDGVWLYFHVLGTWISTCSWQSSYVPGTYRHIYTLHQNPCMLRRLDADWLYFHVPGTWISSCSWHAWYVPGTCRHIYILYQNPPYVMATRWRLIIFLCPRMRDMSLGHVDIFTLCIKKKPYVMAPRWRLIIFPCPRDMH